jgi:ubiquinone/menaquinone biosynthesis C-methylase UbiE
MAEGYATARPPLHARIVARAAELLNMRSPVPVALDLGCGSGISTRALLNLADTVIGIEPNHLMTARARETVPAARFITGQAEAIPLRPQTVDLITAAGSLNYTRLPEALEEAARVLSSNGVLCVYDFAQGRRFRSSGLLASWFDEFEGRCPMPASEALYLDTNVLANASPKFRTLASEPLELASPMTAERYSAYIMTETNIAAAMRQGIERANILAWMRNSLALVFRNNTEEVLFSGYVVCLEVCSGR